METKYIIQKDTTCHFPSFAAIIGGNIDFQKLKKVCLFSRKLSYKTDKVTFKTKLSADEIEVSLTCVPIDNKCINLSLFHIK